MDVKTHSDFVEIQKQIGDITDIIQNLVQMVTDNRKFIEKNAKLSKEIADTLQTMQEIVTKIK
jgi:methyl-accepting chemotaxis protein